MVMHLNLQVGCSIGGRTKNDKYVLFRNGEEFYNRLPDEEQNLVNDEEYKTDINVTRKRCGNNFINIYENQKFRWTTNLEKYLQ